MTTPCLPVRCQLFDDESLASLLARLQIANCYEPSDLRWICRTYSGSNDSWWQPYKASSWDLLATLTGISSQRLYQATCHSYSDALQLPWHAAITTQVGTQLLPALTTRVRANYQRKWQAAYYCPHCLADERYGRLLWQMKLAIACPTHRCLLLSACWRCLAELQLQQLITGICCECGADLTAAEPAQISHKAVQLLSRFIAWLKYPSASTAADWLQQPTPILFELLRGLVAVISPPKRRENSQQFLEHLAYAANVLQDWPHQLFAFLDQLAPVKSGAVASDFGGFYSVWVETRWRHPQLEFLQAVFDDYLVASYPPSFHLTQMARYKRRATLRDRLPFVPYADAALALGISKDFLWFALQAQVVVRYDEGPIIARDEIARLQNHWQHGVPLSDATSLLGMTSQDIPILRSLFDLGDIVAFVSVAAFDMLATALAPTECVSYASNGRSSLQYWVHEQKAPLIPLLKAILDGAIHASWEGVDLWSVSLHDETVLQFLDAV